MAAHRRKPRAARRGRKGRRPAEALDQHAYADFGAPYGEPGLPTPDFGVPILAAPVTIRTVPAPPLQLGRLAPLRTAAVAVAVLGVVAGVGRVAPDPGSSDSVAMAPTGMGVLRGIQAGEELPDVAEPTQGEPEAPRQVAGPEPLKAPTPSIQPATLPTLGQKAPASPASVPASERGIPGAVLAAYRAAATTLAAERPSCHLTWPILAGIGRIESGHARNGDVDAAGTTNTPIVGPALDGTGAFAYIGDSDGGVWDGDTTYDRAVGPMQFLPGTWRISGRDGNGDGKADPNNVRDAALATAGYLCDGGGDMFARDDLLGAIFRYNRSWEYVSNVLTWAGVYSTAGAVATGGTDSGAGKDGGGIAALPAPMPLGQAEPVAQPGPKTPPKPTPKPKPTPQPTSPPTTGPTPGPSTGPTPTPTPTPPAGPSPTPTPEPPAPEPASVAGRVVDDLGRAVAGAHVTLDGEGAGSRTVTSDSDGSFAATGLTPGSYVVEVAAAPGYAVQAGGERYSLTLESAEHRTGVTLHQVTSSLSGRVFRDASGGADDGTQPGVEGVSVRLTGTDARGRDVDATVTTGADGRFAFTGLLGGTYAIHTPVLPDTVTGVLLAVLAPVGDVADGAVTAVPVGAGAVLAGFGFPVGPAPAG